MTTVFDAISEYLSQIDAASAEFYNQMNLDDGDDVNWKASTYTPSTQLLTNVYEVISNTGIQKYLAVHNGDYGKTEDFDWFEDLASVLSSLPSDHEEWTFL